MTNPPREPTEAMRIAGSFADWPPGTRAGEIVNRIWRAMYDAWAKSAAPEPEVDALIVRLEKDAIAWGFNSTQSATNTAALERDAVAALQSQQQRIAELERAVNDAREVAMIRHCDVKENGKTILDFHEVWLRQANDRAAKAEAALAAVTEEQKDWARRFKLNDITPWEWMTRATKAEAERDAARKLLRGIREDYIHTVYDGCDGPMTARIDAALPAQEPKP